MTFGILRWFVYAIAVGVAAYILPGVHVASVASALVLAIVLASLNTFARPILVVLTLPLTLITLGLFVFVINAALVLLAAYVVPGVSVDGFWWALTFSLVLSVVRALLGSK